MKMKKIQQFYTMCRKKKWSYFCTAQQYPVYYSANNITSNICLWPQILSLKLSYHVLSSLVCLLSDVTY